MDQIFKTNLQQFARFCPEAAKQLQDLDCEGYEFCETKKGEKNLSCQKEGRTVYFHSPEGALDEAQNWVETVFPLSFSAILVYGIGLGYYYDALKPWLNDHSGRFLVFIDDDLRAIKRFLQTDKASDLLFNAQVIVQYFPTPKDHNWASFRYQLNWFAGGFCNSLISFQALKMYETEKMSAFATIKQELTLNILHYQWNYAEVFINQSLVSYNLYANLPSLADAGLGLTLKDSFSHIPSIICGAGPSLNPQLNKLKSLRNRALLFAAGTAMNVLTRNGVIPHFGLLIDPYDAQESRFMTNIAYEVPFFYTNRFYHKALRLVHGFRLFLSGDSGKIERWLESQLDIPPIPESLEGGVSTTNMCASLSFFLGSNLIILAGVDMAYTDAKRYASGVAAHPSSSRIQHQEIAHIASKTIPGKGLHGEKIQTKWEWIFEASFFTQFNKDNPNALINTTERGLEIIGVPHVSLDEAVEKYLTHEYDIQNWIHCEIQESYKNKYQIEKILETMKKCEETLEKSQGFCQEIISEIENQLTKLNDQYCPQSLNEIKVLTKPLEDLKQENAYHHFLQLLDDHYNRLAAPDMNKLTIFPEAFSQKRKSEITLQMERGRHVFYKDILDTHLKNIQTALKRYQEDEQKHKKPEQTAPAKKVFKDVYTFKDGNLTIEDEELGILVHEAFHPKMVPEPKKSNFKSTPNRFITAEDGIFEGQALLFYPSGSIKAECFYDHGQLHGPSSFYSEEGKLVAKSWFNRGKRIGKSYQYYRDGQLYSLQRYDKEGNLSGLQEYFYATGIPKTTMNYDGDALNGELTLFHPNGIKKRQQHFQKGMLNGKEYIWNENGILTVESEFKSNSPVGKALTWHPNGQLAKELIFYENPQNFDLQMWDEAGNLIHKHTSIPSDPFKDLLQKSTDLQNSIKEVTLLLETLKKKMNENPEKKTSD